MSNYSENWKHLKSILKGYESRHLIPESYSYEDQRHAKALSIFLANAKLATPKLDRHMVKTLLRGENQWPRSDGEPFDGVNIPLSQLEELGLVSFYANWCSIHCDLVKVNLDSTDASLAPLIIAINYLKDILRGKNGYIKPHYVGSEKNIRKLVSEEFGTHVLLEQLLPELIIQDGNLSLPNGNQYFDSLISTHLWWTLRATMSPEQAFPEWMMCFRVNCDWVMPISFEELQFEEYQKFEIEFFNFLEQEAELKKDINFYNRQSINENNFSYLIQSKTLNEFEIANNKSTISENNEFSAPTLSSLNNIYPQKKIETLNNLDFILEWQHINSQQYRAFFYSTLISNIIKNNIRVENNNIHSSDLLKKIFNLIDSRPILRYLLFIVLPRQDNSDYLLFLLSHSSTSNVAIYYLSKFTFNQSKNITYIQNLEEGYQQLVCYQYMKSIDNELDFSEKILTILEVLGQQCNLQSSEYSKEYKFRFFLNLVNSLENHHAVKIAQTLTADSIPIEKNEYKQRQQHYKYLLVFLLIERLEVCGIDPSGNMCKALKATILEYYSNELSANFNNLHSLNANTFFSTLPWNKLAIEDGYIQQILNLSNKCDEWKLELSYNNSNFFNMAAVIRQYLQVLMCLGKSPSSKFINQVASRVLEIVRLCGFGDSKKFINLFEDFSTTKKYNLWEQFCSYSNTFNDEQYEDFITRCVPYIPLDNIFILLKKCTVIARTAKLRESINIRQTTDKELELDSLEQAFIHACNFGESQSATILLLSAKGILKQDRFANRKNQYLSDISKKWKSYEYKLELLKLNVVNKLNPDIFQNLAQDIPIPHSKNWDRNSPDHKHYEDCEFFKRQIIATTFLDTDPLKSIVILENLYKESKRDHHGFLLLYGHLKLFSVDDDKTRLQHAIAYFLSNAGNRPPSEMEEYWITTIIDAYRIINDSKIDSFWIQLTEEQQTLLQILTPYCRALISRGDSFTTRKILSRYQIVNQSTPEELLGINDLIIDLVKIEKNQPSIKDIILIVNEGTQRSVLQLRKHYKEIIAQDFETYVDIVKPNLSPEEYLKVAVFEVAKELAIRKRNLQIEIKTRDNKLFYKIMKEDWINHWFTSLFDHRMSQSRIGFRDQKEAGESPTGKNPGEIDGFITSADNIRLAIFEAFRLSSRSTSTVSQHLNKIASYDAESLSPVFIVGYCDMPNFSGLCDWYKKYISEQEYYGYTKTKESSSNVIELECNANLWMSTEIRRRHRKEIVFYHILINLHFTPPQLEN